MLELIDVSKQYQKRSQIINALLPTTLTVDEGEFIAIVGPSGSGKTTLLSILGGMLAPSAGEVRFQNQSLYEMDASARARLRNDQIGFVFQSFNLIPWLTALENVKLPLCIFGSDPNVQESRARELLERLGLADRHDHKPAELSAGQQQRVALARTLVTSPKLILADEPTGNLDPESKQSVIDKLRECQQQDRQTVILVTHDQAIAEAADRVLTLSDGHLQEEPESNTIGAA